MYISIDIDIYLSIYIDLYATHLVDSGRDGLGQDIVNQRQRHLNLCVGPRDAQLLAWLRGAGRRRQVLVVDLDEGARGIAKSPNGGATRADKPAHLRKRKQTSRYVYICIYKHLYLYMYMYTHTYVA